MSCTEMVALMPYRALDCLEADEADALAKHLESCGPCATEARARDEALALLAEPIPEEPSLDALWERVATKIAEEKPAVAESAPAPAPSVTIALVCSFCRDVIERTEACYCASCLAPHHGECWKAHGRCSAYGCEETRTVRPEREDAPRPVKRAPAKKRGRRRGLLLALPLLLGGGAVAAIAVRSELAKPRLVSLHAHERDLKEVVAELSREARVPVFVDPSVEEKVSLDVERGPWRETLDALAEQLKCVVRPLGDGALVVEQPPRVTIQFTDANVRTVLQLLAAYSGKNIIISSAVRGDITLDLHEARWDKALVSVCKTVGDYVVEQRGDIILVLPRSQAGRWGTSDLSQPAWPAPLEPGAPEPARVDLDVEDTPLREVCARLEKAAGRPILVAPDVDSRITVHARDTSWRPLLGLLCRKEGFRISEQLDGIHIDAHEKNTLQMTDANIRTVLQLLAARAGLNLTVAPEVHGEATLDLHEVRYEEAIEALSTVIDYEVVRDGNLLRVLPRSSVAQDEPTFTRSTHVSRTRPVGFPNGRTIELALEGILMGPTGSEATRAVISGRVYAKGDVLRDDGGHATGVVVVGIEEKQVELEDGEDPSRPHAIVKVGK